VNRVKMLVAVLAVLAAAVTYGSWIYPDQAKGGGVDFDPDTISGDDELKKLAANCDRDCDPISKIWYNNGIWWYYGNPSHGIRPYMLIRFTKPAGFTGGTMHWKAKTDSNNPVYIYAWNHNDHDFDPEGSIPASENPSEATFAVGGGTSRWDAAGYMYILIKGISVSPSWWELDCDICAVSY